MLAVDGLDVEGQELGRVGLVGAVKTGRLPLEVQVVPQRPGILCEVRASARGKVAVPLLEEVQAV